MTAEVDLGCVQLESVISGLRVQLRSSAKLASPEKGDIARVRTLLTAHKVDPDSAHLPWISKGDNMALVLHLRLEDELRSSVREDLVGTLSSRLRSAQLWQQLSFSEPSVQASADASDGHWIELRLKHTGDTAKRKRKLHKLDVSVPYHDVRPPAEVIQAALETVDMHIEVERRPRKRQRRARSRGYCRCNAIAPVVTTTSKRPGPADELGVDVQLDDMLEDFLITDDPSFESLFELEWHSSRAGNEHDMLLDAFEENADYAATSWSTLPQAIQPNMQFSSLEADSHRTTADSISDLVIMALSTAIAGPRKKRKKGVSVSIDAFVPLASIAPSVWSPGYMAAVADRSVFLSTIAHTISTVTSADTGASSNATRVGLLASVAAGSQECNDAAYPSSPEELSIGLQACLWNKLQQRMYDANAAKRLNEFSSPLEAHSVDPNFSKDMLESTGEPDGYLDLGADMLSGLDLDDDEEWFRYDDNADDHDEWFRSEDDAGIRELLNSSHIDTIFSTERHRVEDGRSNIASTELDQPVNEGTGHDIRCELLHYQSDVSTLTSGGYTTLTSEDDLQSVCSSIEMLSLPDINDCEGAKVDGWVSTEQAEMLVL